MKCNESLLRVYNVSVLDFLNNYDVATASIPFYDMVPEYCGKVSVVNFSIAGF